MSSCASRRAGRPFSIHLAQVICLVGLVAPIAAQGQTDASSSDLAKRMQDPSQWVMPARDYANTRFSSLDEINASNANRLEPAWTFSIGADRGQEAAPIVVDDTMYIVGPYAGPYPNRVFALDATTGELKWSYAPKPEPAAAGVACCDVVNRGLAYDNGKVFLNTLDVHTVAIDAKTGKELWHAKLGEINQGETITMAPIVAHGKVIVGNSGGELGVRGWLTALDEETGRIVWRAYGTGPDADVLIGDDFEPYYKDLKGKDLGVKTWPVDRWRTGGATAWGWVSYDSELNLLYYGTANPSPWNSNQRDGDNLWSATIFARDADTGHAKWAYQLNPHDEFDHDEINENVLVDLSIAGKSRKVLIHPGRNGYMYVIDRQTGEVLSADPYDPPITASKGVDLETGRLIPNGEKTPLLGKTIEDICPAAPGAKDWQPTAWSPRTHLLYVPHQHLCMSMKTSEVGYIAGTPFVGASVDMYAGHGGYRGEFMAWDPLARKRVWDIHENLPVWSGALVTAGDVAFYGTMDRLFKAVDARNGKLLWQFRAGSGFIGQPITYKGSDGRQYVAILAGVGGWPGAIANANIDPRVRNAALGFAGATQDLPFFTAGGSELLVFKLADAPKLGAQGDQRTSTGQSSQSPSPQSPSSGNGNAQPQ
ncbi:MAG: PQQ-dependent dehydrogenase, methanol/ethanol family [Hyphomicrobiales bacterium]|nr:PQQ-dependent dehydrogenase, methanol/ethanol family [Hyphomicrobiales bacterium]